MRTIWKFPICIDYAQEVAMPSGAKPVNVGVDPTGQLCLWAIVETFNSLEPRRFRMIGTGHPLPDAVAVNGYVGYGDAGTVRVASI